MHPRHIPVRGTRACQSGKSPERALRSSVMYNHTQSLGSGLIISSNDESESSFVGWHGRRARRSRGMEAQQAPDEGLTAQSMVLETQKLVFHIHDIFPSQDNSEVCVFNTHLRKHSILYTNGAHTSQNTARKRDKLNGEVGRRASKGWACKT